MARPRGFPVRSRSRRTVAWGLGPNIRDGSASASTDQLWTTSVVATTDKVTIMRTRGYVRIHLLTADAAGAGFIVGLGLGVIPTVAVTAGAGSTPGALSQIDWDGWFWHFVGDIRSVTATIADGVNAGSVSMYIPVDSKAMRKIDGDESVFGSFETVESANATMELQGETRMLLKLG